MPPRCDVEVSIVGLSVKVSPCGCPKGDGGISSAGMRCFNFCARIGPACTMPGGVDAAVEGTAEMLDQNVDDSESTAVDDMAEDASNFSFELM